MSENIQTKPIITTREKQRKITRRIAATAILTAMSVVLMYLEIVLPFMPPFLKFDFSEIPVLVGSFALGPIYAVIIELLKNLIHLPVSGSGGIGELSNFIMGSILVSTAGLIYIKLRTRKGAIISMLIATLVFALASMPFNYFVTLPLYAVVLGFSTEAIVGMSNAVNPMIDGKLNLILWGFLPFNLFKGLVVSFVVFWIYKPISKLINKTYSETK